MNPSQLIIINDGEDISSRVVSKISPLNGYIHYPLWTLSSYTMQHTRPPIKPSNRVMHGFPSVHYECPTDVLTQSSIPMFLCLLCEPDRLP